MTPSNLFTQPANSLEAPFCKIRIHGLGNEWPLQCVSFAADGERKVKIISAVGASTSIKGFSAILQDPRIPARINVTEAINISSYSDYVRCDKGYTVHRARLQDSWWHMVAISRDPQLIPFLDEPSLWAKLKSTNFTTPVMQHWTPYIATALCTATTELHGKALQRCKSFRSNAGIIYANDETLDSIVSEGVRTNSLSFMEQS